MTALRQAVMSTENNATVVRFEKLPDCLFRIWIRPDWSCGASVESRSVHSDWGAETRTANTLRAMTIISIADNIIEFFMVAVTGGVTSPKIAALMAGDRCYVESLITENFHTATLPPATGWIFG